MDDLEFKQNIAMRKMDMRNSCIGTLYNAVIRFSFWIGILTYAGHEILKVAHYIVK
jgi:hypothetical protein